MTRGPAVVLISSAVLGCASTPTSTPDGRVYHCVGTAKAAPLPGISLANTPLERFEYGDYVDTNRPTTGTSSYCSHLSVPKTAYMRYWVEGRVLEKRFDLSTLSVQRVRGKEVEFFVDGNIVEVRLLTPVPGRYIDTKEVIDRR